MELYLNNEWNTVEINGGKENIPTDWDYKNLNALGFLGRGKSKHRPRNDPKLFGDQYPFIQTAEVKEAQLYLTKKSEKFYSDFGLKQSKLWNEGTLCITIAANIAESSILTYKACFPDSVLGFIANENINNVFVKYQIDILKIKMKNSSKGSAQDNLNLDKINLFKLPVPKIEEQNAIVSVLSTQEKTILNIKNLIVQLEKRNQFILNELLSGNLRLIKEDNNIIFYSNNEDNWREVEVNNKKINIPKEWSIEKIKNLFNVFRGKVISKEFIDKNQGNYPVYSSATMNNGSIGEINSYMFDGEYLTWNTDGYAGNVFYRDGKFNCTNVCGVLEPINKISGLASLQVLLMNEFKKFVRTGAQLTNKKLMSNVVENIEFILPQQNELFLINSVVEKLSQEKTAYEKMLKEAEKTFLFLLEELMSGKLRIKI